MPIRVVEKHLREAIRTWLRRRDDLQGKFLSPRTSLIHAVWLNPREIRACAESGATVQHNPWSNLTLGSGVQPTRALLRETLGNGYVTDGWLRPAAVSGPPTITVPPSAATAIAGATAKFTVQVAGHRLVVRSAVPPCRSS